MSPQARSDIDEICEAAATGSRKLANLVFHSIREARNLQPMQARLLWEAVRAEFKRRGIWNA